MDTMYFPHPLPKFHCHPKAGCLRGIVCFPSRDEQDPLYSRRMDSSSTVSGHSGSLVNQDWEKQLMDAGM